MKNKKNVPDIRFKGFAEEWKEHRLGDCADIIGGGTPDTSNREYWDGDIDWYSPAEIGDKVFVDGSKRKITELGLKESSAKVLPIGTVLFSSRAGIGSTAILAKKGATNQGFQSIIPHNGKLNTYFIFSRTRELKKYGETNGAGSTFIEISGKQMESMPIINPEIDEQQAIGNYFQNIDRLINTSQTKLDKLKNIKKACLEKMFPRNGSTTPELRFKGFSEEWKETVIGKFCSITIGEFVIQTKQRNDAPYPVYNGGISYTGFYDEYNNEGCKIIISARGANAGFVNKSEFKYWAGNSCYSVGVLDDTNWILLYYIIKNKEVDFRRIQQSANIPSVSKKQVEELCVQLPMPMEQIRIGSFFKNLDDLIVKTEQRINKLKNIKKACLDKMFVNAEG